MHRVQITWYLFFVGLILVSSLLILPILAPSFHQKIQSNLGTILLWLVGVMFVFEFRNWRKSWEEKKGP